MPEAIEETRGPFEVVLLRSCQDDLDRRCEALPRARDVYDGLLWRLTRDPRCGVKLPLKYGSIPGGEMWMVKTKGGSLPTVILAYVVEGQRISIVNLRISDRDPIL